MDEKNRVYMCIDLKSFYASVECVDRGLDSMKTDLVVADQTRGSGALCLAVSPSLKAKGVKNRCRLFEIPSVFSYIVAPPRMKRYMEMSAYIVSLYLSKISPDDLHVYSIDECFIDATSYLSLYHKGAMELADDLRNLIYDRTGICATAGVGTNLFLAKIAMDIEAKHRPDFKAYLDENLFKETLCHHRPITDFWQIGKGIARRLSRLGVYDLFGVAHIDERILYKEFGVNAEFLIDHAHGREPCTMEDIKSYVPDTRSLSTSQILFSDYEFEDAEMIMTEMADLLTMELIEKRMMTDGISLYVGYSGYSGDHGGGSRKLAEYTDIPSVIEKAFTDLFREKVSRTIPIRQIRLSLHHVVPVKEVWTAGSLFANQKKEEKERNLEQAVLSIRSQFGKNAILRGTSLLPKSTIRMRNHQVGGHHE